MISKKQELMHFHKLLFASQIISTRDPIISEVHDSRFINPPSSLLQMNNFNQLLFTGSQK